ncbi:PSD1 and planctomycete cytochrome C domain-containing protein [Luteolibacter arcticus]|uniref:PSD1 and planctomycete cytochrome C domain-containing protein n=1 Tax=Luteolibacter arcticus TaxID=1581411 RepID=A0ABT3GNG5_9BACT|nr:PSD1 and planctomycete cytochrome C domain-containing protein [Luteolibacter arcticus]MCW1925058.1 PSD1 and planctomycete cytochrome C domain-containing protein [Luteolibacter arcticus]
MKLRYLFVASGAWFAGKAAADEAPHFNRDVRPILSDKCFACHGFDPAHREADLRLDTPEGAQALTDGGKAAIKPGSIKDSEAWLRILSDDPDEVMPPPKSHKTLSPAEKEVIKKWIEAGAPYEKHWAFVAPARPPVPPSPDANPIDAFLAARLKQEGLARSPEADKSTLLRRITLDLTGLPPSMEEMDAFFSDSAPGAYERVVDRLLASPRYGEKMASQWLDLARYGDTNGYLHDILRTGWPWRDWVIRAFNDDMPFDRFVIEQIAGDLLPNASPEQILATAFCRNHLITAEGGTIAEEYLNEYAADRVQTVGTVFMGLTMNCCRCHDHKFDPLKQDDFYSLKAYFNSTTEKHVENNNAAAYPPLIEIASPLAPQGPKAQVMVMQEAAAPVPAYTLTRGQYDQPDKSRPLTRRPPEVLGAPLPGAPVNRLGFAQWLVSPQDPLLARVTVNRLWQQFFSTGLVKSTDDFGLQGDYPSHPELLDWLAIEFRDGNGSTTPWSTRHLVRLIVTSATYRQSSKVRPELAAKDPENRLLASFPRRRLAAEEVRDQALFAAGLMSGELGGPPVFPYQPPGLWEERSNGGSNTKSYTRSNGAALYRRSLYTFWKRTSPPPFMTIFDAPERTSCLVRRVTTNTPLQALAALNDEQVLECSKLLAAQVLRDPSPTAKRLATLYRRVTGRAASANDLRTLESGLSSLATRFQSAPADAAELLKQGATPVDPALNPSELAAWMLVASTILNLDQTLVRD